MSEQNGNRAAVLIRPARREDTEALRAIWNEVVEAGMAFPQEKPLGPEEAETFFFSQSACRVAEDRTTGEVLGLYILHPNNVGRCGHICNTSYAVRSGARGRHIGEQLVRDSLRCGRELNFRILQFNAVVKSNAPALHLYERLGFVRIGEIPGGFRLPDGRYETIVLFYHLL